MNSKIAKPNESETRKLSDSSATVPDSDSTFRSTPSKTPSKNPSHKKHKHKRLSRQAPTFDGYAVSYRRGGYLKKTPEEKVAYREAMEQWKQQTLRGKRLPKPPKGTPDPKVAFLR